jgi:transposase-like protein
VDELVAALGCESGISKSEVSRFCQVLDVQVQALLDRPLELCRFPYIYFDATYLHGRDQARKQVISRAVIVAVGMSASGQRGVLGIEWATVKTRSSGPPSCGTSGSGGWQGCIW